MRGIHRRISFEKILAVHVCHRWAPIDFLFIDCLFIGIFDVLKFCLFIYWYFGDFRIWVDLFIGILKNPSIANRRVFPKFRKRERILVKTTQFS